MRLPKYHLKAESKFTRFEFISEGDKGAICKLIEFQATSEPEFELGKEYDGFLAQRKFK